MGYLSFALLLCLAIAFSKEETLKLEHDHEKEIPRSEEPKNPGKPLDANDFFLASQLPWVKPNKTTIASMTQIIEEGELLALNRTDNTRSGLEPIIRHWANAIVPYVVDASFSSAERAVIAQGIKHVEDNSCIRFIPRVGHHDYLDIVPGGGGCYATVPYWPGRGRMEIGLNQSFCIYMYVVVHELLHILGVMHEQSRPDRDDYITINWEKLKPGGPINSYKDAWVGTDPSTLPGICKDDTLDYDNCFSGYYVSACGLPYDYSSIMHYGAYRLYY